MYFSSSILIFLASSPRGSWAGESCSVCGEGKEVKAPGELFSFPDQPSVSCWLVEQAGQNGKIPIAQCPLIAPLLADICECGPIDDTSKTKSPILISSSPSSPVVIPSTLAPSRSPPVTLEPVTMIPSLEPIVSPIPADPIPIVDTSQPSSLPPMTLMPIVTPSSIEPSMVPPMTLEPVTMIPSLAPIVSPIPADPIPIVDTSLPSSLPPMTLMPITKPPVKLVIPPSTIYPTVGTSVPSSPPSVKSLPLTQAPVAKAPLFTFAPELQPSTYPIITFPPRLLPTKLPIYTFAPEIFPTKYPILTFDPAIIPEEVRNQVVPPADVFFSAAPIATKSGSVALEPKDKSPTIKEDKKSADNGQDFGVMGLKDEKGNAKKSKDKTLAPGAVPSNQPSRLPSTDFIGKSKKVPKQEKGFKEVKGEVKDDNEPKEKSPKIKGGKKGVKDPDEKSPKIIVGKKSAVNGDEFGVIEPRGVDYIASTDGTLVTGALPSQQPVATYLDAWPAPTDLPVENDPTVEKDPKLKGEKKESKDQQESMENVMGFASNITSTTTDFLEEGKKVPSQEKSPKIKGGKKSAVNGDEFGVIEPKGVDYFASTDGTLATGALPSQQPVATYLDAWPAPTDLPVENGPTVEKDPKLKGEKKESKDQQESIENVMGVAANVTTTPLVESLNILSEDKSQDFKGEKESKVKGMENIAKAPKDHLYGYSTKMMGHTKVAKGEGGSHGLVTRRLAAPLRV
jgi:hypothetical protein